VIIIKYTTIYTVLYYIIIIIYSILFYYIVYFIILYYINIILSSIAIRITKWHVMYDVHISNDDEQMMNTGIPE
jgi:hypothetical protein